MVTATSYVGHGHGWLPCGRGATAAISVTASCNWLINGVIMALGVGYSVRAAYFIGAGEPEMVRKTLIQSVIGSLILGIGAMLIGTPLLAGAAKMDGRGSGYSPGCVPLYAGADDCAAGTDIPCGVLRNPTVHGQYPNADDRQYAD